MAEGNDTIAESISEEQRKELCDVLNQSAHKEHEDMDDEKGHTNKMMELNEIGDFKGEVWNKVERRRWPDDGGGFLEHEEALHKDIGEEIKEEHTRKNEEIYILCDCLQNLQCVKPCNSENECNIV